jgi:hypothetical protein
VTRRAAALTARVGTGTLVPLDPGDGQR